MSKDSHWIRAPAPASPVAPGRPRDRHYGPGTILHALSLGAVVFVAAVLTAGLLAGAAPAVPVEPTRTVTSDPAGSVVAVSAADVRATTAPDPSFAYSMIYTGATALLVSIIGTVMVARRRRFW